MITMDVEMPVMDGLQALEKIMNETPLPVVMLSSLTQKGADATVRALNWEQWIYKPSLALSVNFNDMAKGIVKKIRVSSVARDKLHRPLVQNIKRPLRFLRSQVGKSPQKLVLVGTSTGGPKALYEVIPKLPGDLPAAVLVVQHMPPGFTRSLAERIDSMSALKVKEAEDGESVLNGNVYIAPGDYHLKVRRVGEGLNRRLKIDLTKDPLVSGHRPSVDAMIESVLHEYWSKVLAVIMTGMGSDGTKGSAIVRIGEEGHCRR